MDLHPIHAEPSAEEREAIDALLGPPPPEAPRGLRHARALRHLLLPALHAAQARAGWVSPGALLRVPRARCAAAEGYGVASFYPCSPCPRPPVVAHVCDDIACKLSGADALCGDLEAGAPRPLGGPAAERTVRRRGD